jgi:predicted membrane protein
MTDENQPKSEHQYFGLAVRGRSGSVLVGIMLVILGALFLLEHQGVLPGDTFYHIWPLIFVLVGLAHMFGPRTPKDRAWGALLMLFGILLTAGEFGVPMLRFHRLWPFALIALGIYVMWASLLERSHRVGDLAARTDAIPSDAQLDSVNIFGGGEYRINAKNFRGGRVLAVFGGFELDLRQADIEGQEAVVEVNTLFGGGEIRIPQTWNLVVSGMGIFGGYGDETLPPPPNPAAPPAKTFILKGVSLFGGVSIKN